MFFYQQNKHFYSKAPQNAGSVGPRDENRGDQEGCQGDEEGV